jgi:hypothetical protein
MPPVLSDKACKAIIIRVARKLNVEARLITTRLMSEEDKDDMRAGLLPIEALEAHIKVWMDNGMPDYAHGKTIPLKHEAQEV